MIADLDTGSPLVIGVDLGGTKILAAVVGPNYRILGRAKRPTPAEAGGPAILAGDHRHDRPGPGRGEGDLGTTILAIGIGSPGPLDPSPA